jgi:hypothetical protein
VIATVRLCASGPYLPGSADWLISGRARWDFGFPRQALRLVGKAIFKGISRCDVLASFDTNMDGKTKCLCDVPIDNKSCHDHIVSCNMDVGD